MSARKTSAEIQQTLAIAWRQFKEHGSRAHRDLIIEHYR